MLLETPSGFAVFDVREDVFRDPKVCPNTLVMNHLFSFLFFLVPCNGSLNSETDKFFFPFLQDIWIYFTDILDAREVQYP